MTTLMKAALGAMVVLAGVPASAGATGFIRYDVATLGQRFSTTQDPGASIPRTSTDWVSYIFAVVVPTDADGPWALTGSSYASATTHAFIAGTTTVTAGPNNLSFSEVSSTSTPSYYNWGEISGSACVDAASQFVTSGFKGNCGSVHYANAWRSGWFDFTGGIVDVSVSTGTTASVMDFGIVSVQQVALVPEPATWALMALGFGLAGYTLRRRKDRVVFA